MTARWMGVQVACVYIGTVVGAGFASGREIYEFFVRFGPIAYVAILFVTVLFAWLGYRLMALGALLQATSFRDLNAYLFKPRLQKCIDIVLLLMLFGITVAMLAGTGELFKEQFHLPFSVGVLAAMIVTFLTMFFGMNGLLKVNSVIVPTLVTFVLYTAIHTWMYVHPTTHAVVFPEGQNYYVGFPVWLSSLLYAAMNIGLSVGVLVPLGGQIGDLRILRRGATMGAIGLGGMLVAVSFALFAYMPDATAYAIPMAYIASHFAPWLKILFIAVLFGEIYSTLIGNVYALAVTMTNERKRLLLYSGVLLIFAGLLSHVGFRAIVTYAYTAFGWISLFFVLTIALHRTRLPRA
ncbi:YkvI family membrane protein [Alicyclobacillus fastidiosus]|uniref:Membrane protein YkvI n=1 Tax=Alicyclobacillus fastidiosus TaxID=392011 RepID=A0ABV5AAS1_9BACL|nr:hypothetical protein [Alicyclobacillus fastidiosus]WEH11860.1 hypothetical protein PYS47_11930 [Alicyclobacillus fastidiosus]